MCSFTLYWDEENNTERLGLFVFLYSKYIHFNISKLKNISFFRTIN